jgi:hypothetical protein
MISRVYPVLLVLATASCSKSPSSDGAPSASSTGAALNPSASAARAAAPSGSNTPPGAASAAGTASAGSFSGTYTAKVGAVTPPENAKEKAWAADPGTAAVGQGTIDFSVSGTRGETQGDTKGALGEMTISGVFDGKELRANLIPKDPKAENAMTGFMTLTAAAPAAKSLKGILRVSNRDARLVREANVEVSAK